MGDLYSLPTARKKLSKAELLKKKDRIYQEDFPINMPEYDGDVTIRAVADQGEFNSIQNEIERLTAINKTIGLHGKTRDVRDIWVAVYCCACMVDPDINIDEAFEMLDNLGPVTSMIANRILTISGLTSGSVEEEEKKLRADSFSADATSPKFQISEAASKRARSNDERVG